MLGGSAGGTLAGLAARRSRHCVCERCRALVRADRAGAPGARSRRRPAGVRRQHPVPRVLAEPVGHQHVRLRARGVPGRLRRGVARQSRRVASAVVHQQRNRRDRPARTGRSDSSPRFVPPARRPTTRSSRALVTRRRTPSRCGTTRCRSSPRGSAHRSPRPSTSASSPFEFGWTTVAIVVAVAGIVVAVVARIVERPASGTRPVSPVRVDTWAEWIDEQNTRVRAAGQWREIRTLDGRARGCAAPDPASRWCRSPPTTTWDWLRTRR